MAKENSMSLEAKVAACIIAVFLVFLLIRSPISGFAVLENEQVSNTLNSALVFVILGLFAYFIFKKRMKNKKSRI